MSAHIFRRDFGWSNKVEQRNIDEQKSQNKKTFSMPCNHIFQSSFHLSQLKYLSKEYDSYSKAEFRVMAVIINNFDSFHCHVKVFLEIIISH